MLSKHKFVKETMCESKKRHENLRSFREIIKAQLKIHEQYPGASSAPTIIPDLIRIFEKNPDSEVLSPTELEVVKIVNDFEKAMKMGQYAKDEDKYAKNFEEMAARTNEFWKIHKNGDLQENLELLKDFENLVKSQAQFFQGFLSKDIDFGASTSGENF